MSFIGLARLRIIDVIRKNHFLIKHRRKYLHNNDFTIISNNCWGGMIYQSYGLQFQTPTIGLFFMAKDYISFLSDLKGFINSKLEFIDPSESKWKDHPSLAIENGLGQYPVGVLSNGKQSIEILFLHYHSREEAEKKWKSRCQRINWDNLIVKFNDQNGCEEEDIQKFFQLNYTNKLFFTCKHWNQEKEYSLHYPGYYYIKQGFDRCRIDITKEPFGKNRILNMTEYLNRIAH